MLLTSYAVTIPQIVLWVLLFAFSVWGYRKHDLKSLLWLAVYLVWTPIVALLTSTIVDDFINRPDYQTAARGIRFIELVRWKIPASDLAHLILAVLILSDILKLILKAGSDISGKFWATLYAVGQRSTLLGIFTLLAQAIPLIGMFIYIHILLKFP